MNPENKQYLDDNRHHYDTYVRAQYIKQFDGATKNRLLSIIHQEFNAGYPDPTYCQTCVAEMLVYTYVQYDKWIAAQPKEEPAIEPVPELVAEPAELDGAILKTTFPAHKKKGRRKK